MFIMRLAAIAVAACGITACAAPEMDSGTSNAAPIGRAARVVANAKPHPTMLRFPDVGATHIVFVYADDLWIAPREGGMASPLASPSGFESFPKFSADGKTIAFVGNYDGNSDLYTIPADGGVPTRVTHHPARETLCDWTGDGRLLYFSNAFAGLGRQTQLMTVAATGGLPSKLPPPYGANGAISADGEWLAYTPHSRDGRTWKRYRGGMATDIWLFNLRTNESRKITDWDGTDSQPMWHGKNVYYLSDGGPNHRLNIWMYDTTSRRSKQITKFRDYDVKWPSVGPGPAGKGEIIFQNGADLHLLDLATSRTRVVELSIPGDLPLIRPHTVDASKLISNWNVSSTGKRVVVEARGDIWTLPAKDGAPRNLTRSDGSAERDPAWSPDGQWIAFFGDASGEYELYVTQSDGNGETRQLTSDANTFRYLPVWSPDSKHIAFTDKTGALHLHTIDPAGTKLIDTDTFSTRIRANWSSDSQWITYSKNGLNNQSAVWLYNVESGEKTQATSGRFNDTWPTFDRKGDYLFFASNRDFGSPTYEDLGNSFIYADTDILIAVPLRDKVGSPWAPKNDEESWKDKDKDEGDDDKNDDDDAEDGEDSDDKDGDSKDGDNDSSDDDSKKSDDDKKKDKEKDKKPKPVVIELEGFERRAVKVPVKRGSFSQLAVSDRGKLLYARAPRRGSDDKPSIKILDLKDEKKEEKTVASETGAFRISADGEKLLIRKGKKMYIVDAKADQKLKKAVPQSGMNARVTPRAEWRQMFHEAWRIHRDFFYDPNMHGVDWKAMHRQYSAMLDDCVSRRDVAYVIGEMVSELNVGHAYVRGAGDVERAPRVTVGMLGADFELHNGGYRITKIYEGAAWDIDARGPLSQPGVKVSEGDYLLAVNGVSPDMSKDPWALFQGQGGKIVTITVSEKPTRDEDARDVVVKCLGSDRNLRYRAWIERNRKYVDEQTDGRVGYIYVPNTGRNGQNDLIRQFFGQVDKKALIIDERWNGGGQIPTRFIELLNRPVTNYWAVRNGKDWTWPPDAHQGPKCMLINGLAGSGGDAFPAYFRQAGLGKLIGMRTWGGLVGYSGNPTLLDGGGITSPTFAYYEKDGTWGIEGHGVDPDIEVVDDPAKMVDGGDPQLDVAIKQMLSEIRENGYNPPNRPSYPDRSGMGITDEDK